MVYALDSVAVPFALLAILAGTLLAGANAAREGYRRRHRRPLPQGADAALWSITEVLPDPRNHLAIKDPTSELRLTDDERRVAAQAAADARARSDASPSRPAQVAADSQRQAAREAALVKRNELARERDRRELAQRDPAAFASAEVVDQLAELWARTEGNISPAQQLPARVAS